MEDQGVLIVGGGLAAQRCAETLRRRGYEGPVRMVCAEPDPPYDRPPLSKELLAGTVEEESVTYRPAWWYEEKQVELLLGARAEALDPEARTVALDSAAELRYEKLLIATGGRGAAAALPRGLRERPRSPHPCRRAPAAPGAGHGSAPGNRRPASSARRSPPPPAGSASR